MKPVAEIMGSNNAALIDARTLVDKGQELKDQRFVIVTPTRGEQEFTCKCGDKYKINLGIHPNVVMCWQSLMMPLNTKHYRLMISNAPVDVAYNTAIKMILEHPELRSWKYLITIEDDQMMNPDALLKLLKTAKEGDWDAVSGLVWVKRDEVPIAMIYGDPADPESEHPVEPKEDQVQECNAMGMGFTLFNLDMFREGKIEKPFFKTVEDYTEEERHFCTQDLYFFKNAKRAGYRFCVDTRIKIGHLDVTTGKVY